jgi:hypothetical protein
MAHSIATFKTCTYLVRDDVLALIVRHLAKYSGERNIEWLTTASQEWIDHCNIMPPGAKKLELDRWVTSEESRIQFIEALNVLSSKTHDPKIRMLMHLEDLKACLDS